ncbi:Putative YrbE family protein [Mycobacteroides abscessus]|nr:Putative YrbE family protein [Mycobacteroides abscessus]
MATSRPSRYFPDELPAAARSVWNFTKGAGGSAEYLGHQITFVGLVLAAIPQTLRRYRRQTGILLVDMTWGNGSIIVGGGVIGVLVFMGIAVGASVGIVGFSTLDMVGMGSLTGFISAYVNTREMAPMIAAIGFAAQAGCRMTAEIGAMRISEEIDALEAQGIRSIPFVVTTRVIAGIIIIVPLYVLTLLLAYGSCAFMVFFVHNQSQGVYKHYFDSFVHPVGRHDASACAWHTAANAKRGNTALDTDHELHHTKPPYVMQGTSNPVLRKWKH